MQKIKSKKGISLIVLVITIIVMIILAAAIILSLNNAGIIGNANKAVEMTNDAQVQTAADLAYAEYLIDNSVVGEGSTLETWLNEKVDYEGYNIHVVDDEPIVVKEGSLADMFYNEEIKIGDYVNYKAAETSKTVDVKDLIKISDEQPSVDAIVEMEVSSEMKWKVLGVDKVTKELLIVSADVIEKVKDKETGEEKGLEMAGFYGWLHGKEILDNACAEFGKGTHATKGRSITVEDINKITNYDMTKYVDSQTGTKYGEKVYFDDEEQEGTTLSIRLQPKKDANGNYILNENRVPETELETTSIIAEYYSYEMDAVLTENSVEHNLLCKNDEGERLIYLTSSKILHFNNNYNYYSYFGIGVNSVTNVQILGFIGSYRVSDTVVVSSSISIMGIRPVVHLNANLTATFENNEWVLK